jgi:hypothetical protein
VSTCHPPVYALPVERRWRVASGRAGSTAAAFAIFIGIIRRRHDDGL